MHESWQHSGLAWLFEVELRYRISGGLGLCARFARWDWSLTMIIRYGEHFYSNSVSRSVIMDSWGPYRNAYRKSSCFLPIRNPLRVPKKPENHRANAYDTRIPGVRPTNLERVSLVLYSF